MGTITFRSIARLFALASLALGTGACSKSASPEAADAGSPDAAAAPPSAPGTVSPGAGGPEAPRPSSSAGGKRIQVAIKDVQLFPSSRVYLVSVNDVAEMRSDDVDARPMPLTHVKLDRSYRMTDADLVESDPIEIEIHPRALTLQLVKLPTGEQEHASGNVVIRQKEGKIVYEEMARLKMSLHGVERSDVPATPPEVSFEADELSGRVASISLVPSAEDASLAKGQKKVQVTWKLSLKGELIETRLRAPLDAATSTLENAQRAAEAAEADASADAAVVAKAKADLAAAKAAKAAAETKYKTGLGSERGKLAKLFPCGDVKLATNKAVRSTANGKAASDACKALDKENEVEVTLTYTLDRYELPVALAYSLGKSPAFRPVASEPLLKLDPR